MAAWDVIESAVEYETPWYTGGYDLVEQPDGSTHRYYWADLPPAVIVVPILGDDVVFVEQYRPTVGETFLELPAGIVEDGESFAAAAARELEEETGYAAGSLEQLGSCWAATGVLRHERGFVAATDLDPGPPDRGDNEFIEVRRVPAERAVDVVRSPPANDATLGALLLALQDGIV